MNKSEEKDNKITREIDGVTFYPTEKVNNERVKKLVKSFYSGYHLLDEWQKKNKRRRRH